MERPRKRARIENSSTSKSSTAKPVFEQVSTLSSKYRMNDMADSEVYYVPDFIRDSTKAVEWYKALLGLDSCEYFWISTHRSVHWASFVDTGYQPKLKMFGRESTQSRKIAGANFIVRPKSTLEFALRISVRDRPKPCYEIQWPNCRHEISIPYRPSSDSRPGGRYVGGEVQPRYVEPL